MADYEAVYSELRAIMLTAAGDLLVTKDAPGDLEIRTHDVDTKTGKPGWFGTVSVKKSYAAYHLMPLYADPGLAEGLSPVLAKRRQGKTCFNFKVADPALFAELAALTAKARAAVR